MPMIVNWTNEDIEAILRQLNDQALPFKKYVFSALDNGLHILGRGSTANVYKAETRDKHKEGYAIKVIGFGDKHVESGAFNNSVSAQKNLGQFQNNVVKIYDSTEIRVWIEGDHTVTKAEVVKEDEDKEPAGEYLKLQFVLMEELANIVRDARFGKPTLISALNKYDEKEILKLAYDIGTALRLAHENKLIHRDVKLENIFYSARGGGHYKLGDFGIARTTDNGLASTVAFTRGYGAPEVVGTLEDKYDCTADVYSFGMVLYVLLNELRFPESNNYHPNPMQYMYGYIPDHPIHGSDELCRIVTKMLAFDPNDRYQTMDEVLNELEKLQYGRALKYQREHKSISLVMGTAFAFIGAVCWKLSFAPDISWNMTLWMYLFWGLCACKGILSVFKKKIYLVSTGILGIGVYLLVVTGFTVPKLMLVLFLALFGSILTGIAGGSMLLINATYLIMNLSEVYLTDFSSIRWITVLLLSLSCILLFHYELLGERDPKITKAYFKRNLYWIIIAALYAEQVLLALSINSVEAKGGLNFFRKMIGERAYEMFAVCNPMMIGIGGVVFCLIWIGREQLLIFLEKQQEKKAIEDGYY